MLLSIVSVVPGAVVTFARNHIMWQTTANYTKLHLMRKLIFFFFPHQSRGQEIAILLQSRNATELNVARGARERHF